MEYHPINHVFPVLQHIEMLCKLYKFNKAVTFKKKFNKAGRQRSSPMHFSLFTYAYICLHFHNSEDLLKKTIDREKHGKW